MSIDAKAEIVIDRPRSDVANVMFDPKNDKLWIGGLINVFPQSPGLLTVGAKVERVGSFLGRNFSSTYLVTKAEPERSVEIAADEPFQMLIKYDLSDTENGTLTKLHIRSVGENEYQIPQSALNRSVLEAVTNDLKRLKKRVEA